MKAPHADDLLHPLVPRYLPPQLRSRCKAEETKSKATIGIQKATDPRGTPGGCIEEQANSHSTAACRMWITAWPCKVMERARTRKSKIFDRSQYRWKKNTSLLHKGGFHRWDEQLRTPFFLAYAPVSKGGLGCSKGQSWLGNCKRCRLAEHIIDVQWRPIILWTVAWQPYTRRVCLESCTCRLLFDFGTEN